MYLRPLTKRPTIQLHDFAKWSKQNRLASFSNGNVRTDPASVLSRGVAGHISSPLHHVANETSTRISGLIRIDVIAPLELPRPLKHINTLLFIFFLYSFLPSPDHNYDAVSSAEPQWSWAKWTCEDIFCFAEECGWHPLSYPFLCNATLTPLSLVSISPPLSLSISPPHSLSCLSILPSLHHC